MSVTVTVNPTAPDAAKDFCAVTVAGADQNDDTAYNANNYPASPEMRYYLTFEKSSVEYGRSYIFGVDETGGHLFMNYVFPEAGTWVVHLRDESDDSSVANSGNVTVS
jgi:hypothetical protein